jgi:hypothetical protein
VIDFRYHLVSIIAVFLALAVGLVVGSTALSGPAVSALSEAQRLAVQQNATLRQDNKSLTDQLNAERAFAVAASPRLLDGLLSTEKVVVVTAPAADAAVTNGVTTALRQAGATVTGEVNVNSAFLLTDGKNEDELTQLAQNQAATAGIKLPPQAAGPITGQQAAARVLAASLLSKGGTDPASAGRAAILSAFSQQGYISIGNGASSVSEPASLAVLVAPGPSAPQTGSRVLAALAVALRNAGVGTVMAGDVQSAGARSVISDEASSGQVSTVDNADTEAGQIMTVQALKLLLDHAPPGQYGIGPGAAPSPAPTPSSSVTSTATPSAGTSSGGHK